MHLTNKFFFSVMFIVLIFFFKLETQATEIKIIDGDTIIINNEKIRFWGIDTPELSQTCKKKEKKIYCGILAKNILIKKIGNKIPKCIKKGEDIYKRTLAECFVSNESLSTFLVRSGYAFAYRKYSKNFIQDEEYAKNNDLGLWSMEFKYPWEFRKK